MRNEGIPVYVTGSVRLRVTLPFLAPARLWSMVRRADIVHILGYWNLLSVATAFCARLAGKPYLFSAAGEFAALASPRPAALWFHRLLGRRMIRQAAALIAITERERRQIIDQLGFDEGRVITVPNGVEGEESFADAGDFLPSGRFVLFVGRLAEIKGPDLLLSAFARVCERHPDIKLVLAGPDFGLGPQLRARASDPLLADRVIFPGFVNERDRAAAYRKAMFLVVPSRAEAMSLVAVEAGVSGIPVLVTDQCGLDEIREVGGGAVCAADVQAIAVGLEEMLSATDLAERGRNWRRHVLENYTWTGITTQLLRHIERLQ